MDSLIPVINKLQDVFNTVGENIVELPQIVTVGNQSAGKSSVIEAIVGKDFLPRGTGIVTRCPLILQLIQIKENSPYKKAEDGTLDLDEWAKFLHSEEIYTDFENVREEIERETEHLSGQNKQITSKPITLKIFSKNCVDLTLVDLPGLTKVPVGDQPEDIEDQIRELIIKYISNPNSIILAVTPANIDFATSEAVKLSREVDPDGVRTLAVLTKLDLMDAGTDAVDVLLSRVIPVRLGIIGVVNRSQQDINNSKSIADALKDEAAFFKKNYAKLASCNGSKYLVKKLNEILMAHIRHCLPDLKDRIRQKEAEESELRESLGQQLQDQAQKSNMAIKTIHEFVEAYRNEIESTEIENIQTEELIAGARICNIFEETFCEELDKVEPLKGLTDKEIKIAIRNATGILHTFGVPQPALEFLIKKQLKQLMAPSLKCAEWVNEELENIVRNCASKIGVKVSNFPNLVTKILVLTSEMLRVRLPITNQKVKDILQSELAYISFKGSSVADLCDRLVNPKEPEQKNSGDSLSDPQCEDVKELVQIYFNSVREQLKNQIPKLTANFLVFYVKQNLRQELVEKINRMEILDHLLAEDKDVPEKRNASDLRLDALRQAIEVIAELDHIRV